MNRFSELLLQAFDIAMDEKVSGLSYDKTIQATITKIENPDTGEYKVKYQDGIISAFASDPKDEFKIDEAVYVTVPEGNFSNKKFISHKLASNSLSVGQYSQLAETIIEVSPDISNMDNNINYQGDNSVGYGLHAGNYTDAKPDEINILTSNEPINISDSVKLYLDKYEYLQIRAEFRTQFSAEDEEKLTKGDYGLYLIFADSSGKLIPYHLTTDDFIGDPYHLWGWTPQSIVVKFPKGTITALAGLKFYENNFDNGFTEEDANNIFVRNISISFVEKVDLTQTPYYLTIVSDKGMMFQGNNSTTLEGKIIHYGSEINPDNCIYKWFQRDLSVTVGSEKYDKRVGWGWTPVLDSSGQEIESKTLTVNPSSISNSRTYKLLAVYDTNTIMTKEITLVKELLQVEIQQELTDGKFYLKLCELNGSDATAYAGDWYRLTPSGEQEQLASKAFRTDDLTDLLAYSPVTIYCSVYRRDNNDEYVINCGELNYVMRNIESIDDISITFIGESTFIYDANGDYGITAYDAEIERSITPEIVFNNGVMGSSEIEWLDGSGNLLGDEPYTPENSMIQSARVDKSTNTLYYKIKRKFQEVPSKKNNTFYIRVTTIDGQTYLFEKEFIFVKTGDPGTNGTKYWSLIKIASQNKFVGVNNSDDTSVKLECDVYRDSELLIPGSGGVTIDFKWTYTNLSGDIDSGSTVIVKANNSTRTRLAKATITITDNGKTTVLYDFFPVNSCASQPSIDLSELPKYIQYASNGRNPQFRKQIPVIKYNNTQAKIGTADTATIKISNDYFKPIDEFDPSKPMGLLTVTVSGITIYHPVPMYINTFGNEAINGWDGVSVDLGDEANHSIFAPQIGAGGKKNSSNKFTGVVMGQDSGQKQIGLYGYQEGQTSFGLMEDGTAFFGKSGQGRIEINGTEGTIEGGGGGSSSTGMTITLAAKNATTGDAIRVGNDNFVVTYGGIMTAKGATIDGHLYALDGKIGSTSKTFSDGWTITTNRIASGSGSNYVALDSGSATIQKQAKYYTNTALTANEKTISGDTQIFNYTTYTYSGKTCVSFKLSGDSTTYYTLATNTSVDYAIWAGATFPNQSNEKFSVKRDGTVFMREAIVKGTITAKAGAIGCDNNGNGGWIIKTNTLSSESFTEEWIVPIGAPYYTNIDCKDPYAGITTSTHKVTKAGDNVWTWSGTGSNTTYYAKEEDVVLNTNKNIIVLSVNNNQVIQAGAVTDGKAAFSVAKTGKLRAQNAEIVGTITADNGKIGGWKIEADQLSSGDVYLYGGNDDGYKLNNSAYRFWAGSSTPSKAKFYVLNNGNVKATAADITGTVNAKKGYIGCDDNGQGGWIITKSTLSSTSIPNNAIWYLPIGSNYYTNLTNLNNDKPYSKESTSIHFVTKNDNGYWTFSGDNNTYYVKEDDILPSDQNMVIFNSKAKYVIQAGKLIDNKKIAFSVSKEGKLVAQDADIVGTITAKNGEIGGWKITTDQLSSGNVYLYSGTNTAKSKTVILKKNATYYQLNNNRNGYSGGMITNTTADIEVNNISAVTISNTEYIAFKFTGNNTEYCAIKNNTNFNIDYYRIWAGSKTPGSADFFVTDKGYLFANNATIKGSVEATSGSFKGTIYAKEGRIGCDDNGQGGWVITKSTLASESYSESSTGLLPKGSDYYKDEACTTLLGQTTQDRSVTKNNNKVWYFISNSNKTYYVKDEDVSPTSTSTDVIILSSKKYYAIQAGHIENNKPIFSVTKTGKLTASGADITGTISTENLSATGGTIGGWTIGTNTLTGGNVTLNASDGSISGANISGGTLSITGGGNGSLTVNSDGVSITGNVTTGNLSATGGTIGGWYISSDAIQNAETSPTVKLDSSDGSIVGAKYYDSAKTNYSQIIPILNNEDEVIGSKFTIQLSGVNTSAFQITCYPPTETYSNSSSSLSLRNTQLAQVNFGGTYDVIIGTALKYWQLAMGSLSLSAPLYGSSLPNNPRTGQIYFKTS